LIESAVYIPLEDDAIGGIRMRNITALILEVIRVFREAAERFEDARRGDLHVCLDCRKVYTSANDLQGCWEKRHTFLSWGRSDDIDAVVEILEWLLKEAKGND